MTADLLSLGPDVDPAAPVARANPVAKLAAALAVSLALLLTVDLVTPAVALVLEIAVLPWCGVRPAGLGRRGLIVLIGAVPAALGTAVFGIDAGATVAGLGPVTITEGSAAAGLAIGLRVLAVGLPGVVLLATTDPSDLAGALSQVLRVPARFSLAALAALRLAGLLAQEWESLSLARRARGLDDRGPAGVVRSVGARLGALLVLAVRRATTLAVVMEARGFGISRHRTWARPSRFGLRDALVLAGGIGIAAGATAVAVAAGTWRLVLS